MRVLVCGGRDYRSQSKLDAELDAVHAETSIDCLIEGGALGADHLAAVWSAKRKIEHHRRFSADWALHGRAAGPMRNKKMLDEGKPDLVVAFPGHDGTADMVKQARADGVPVKEIA